MNLKIIDKIVKDFYTSERFYDTMIFSKASRPFSVDYGKLELGFFALTSGGKIDESKEDSLSLGRTWDWKIDYVCECVRKVESPRFQRRDES